MSKDYYKTLGVEKSASQDEIKKAFRKMAHKYHPDKKTGDEAMFKEVNEAYQVLGDENKRKQYDQFGAGFEQQGGFGGGMNWEDFMKATRGQGGFQGGFGGVDFGDIFGDMFGFGGGDRGGSQVRGRDIQVDVELEFEEAVFGVEKEINLTKRNACEDCSGNGAEKGTDLKTCSECNGQGRVVRIQQTMFGAMQSQSTCPICSGQGRIPEKSCKKCGGDGSVRSESNLKVRIPEGIHSGASIRVTGQGEHPGVGGAAGDLYVRIHVKPSDKYTREDQTIHSEAEISISQAILGDSIDIATLDGEKKLKIPAGTQSHQKFRLKGLGVPSLRGGSRGDHYVKVTVKIPKRISKKGRDLLKKLEDEVK